MCTSSVLLVFSIRSFSTPPSVQLVVIATPHETAVVSFSVRHTQEQCTSPCTETDQINGSALSLLFVLACSNVQLLKCCPNAPGDEGVRADCGGNHPLAGSVLESPQEQTSGRRNPPGDPLACGEHTLEGESAQTEASVMMFYINRWSIKTTSVLQHQFYSHSLPPLIAS